MAIPFRQDWTYGASRKTEDFIASLPSRVLEQVEYANRFDVELYVPAHCLWAVAQPAVCLCTRVCCIACVCSCAPLLVCTCGCDRECVSTHNVLCALHRRYEFARWLFHQRLQVMLSHPRTDVVLPPGITKDPVGFVRKKKKKKKKKKKRKKTKKATKGAKGTKKRSKSSKKSVPPKQSKPSVADKKPASEKEQPQVGVAVSSRDGRANLPTKAQDSHTNSGAVGQQRAGASMGSEALQPSITGSESGSVSSAEARAVTPPEDSEGVLSAAPAQKLAARA